MPDTNIIGSNAATIVRVATIVGLPTSSVAWMVAWRGFVQPSDHHDRVIHQDADGKDQREQADAVDRVAHQP